MAKLRTAQSVLIAVVSIITACCALSREQAYEMAPPPQTPGPEALPTVEVELDVLDRAGKPSKLRQHGSGPILVAVWAAWCEPCRWEMDDLPVLQANLAEAGADIELVLMSVDEDPADAWAFIDDNGVTLPNVVLDRETPEPARYLREVLGVNGLPATILVDANGRLAHRHTGFVDWKDQAWVELLAGALAD